jgi:hypothetical protein
VCLCCSHPAQHTHHGAQSTRVCTWTYHWRTRRGRCNVPEVDMGGRQNDTVVRTYHATSNDGPLLMARPCTTLDGACTGWMNSLYIQPQCPVPKASGWSPAQGLPMQLPHAPCTCIQGPFVTGG